MSNELFYLSLSLVFLGLMLYPVKQEEILLPMMSIDVDYSYITFANDSIFDDWIYGDIIIDGDHVEDVIINYYKLNITYVCRAGFCYRNRSCINELQLEGW